MIKIKNQQIKYLFASLLLNCFLLASINGYSQKLATKQAQFVIKNVNVITMTSTNEVISNATVWLMLASPPTSMSKSPLSFFLFKTICNFVD
jgi:hypothetical protein